MDFDGVKICGVPDHLGGGDCAWPFADVAVYVTGGGMLGQVEVSEALEAALGYWNAVCGIRLAIGTNHKTAHIAISGSRIDGPNGTLALSELPCGFSAAQWRQLQQSYDLSEVWTIAENPPGGKIDAVRVICHEIGHAIGISHINDGNLMAPVYSARIRKPQRGDIAEARSRYGLPGPIVPPVPPPDPPIAPGASELVRLTLGGVTWEFAARRVAG